MAKRIDITGQKFNYLTAIKYVDYDKNHRSRWLFKCDCGNEKILDSLWVRKGNIKSCGCYNSRVATERMIKHGLAKTKEHSAWCNIKGRCFNPNEKSYKYYGARGITVCDRWLDSFENFFEDMGYAPSHKHSIDRIDVNGNYEPSNCRWATDKQQGRNKTNNINITYKNEIHCLAEWCEILNLKYKTIQNRLGKYKWDVVRAFETPIPK